MSKKAEILTINDIRLLVDTFYGHIRDNRLLGPIFETRIQGSWPAHLEKMYRFWQTVLLEEHTYFGSPFLPHAQLPVDAEHFKEWMALFTATVNGLFTGDKAREAIWRAGKMAEMFQLKIATAKNSRLHIL